MKSKLAFEYVQGVLLALEIVFAAGQNRAVRRVRADPCASVNGSWYSSFGPLFSVKFLPSNVLSSLTRRPRPSLMVQSGGILPLRSHLPCFLFDILLGSGESGPRVRHSRIQLRQLTLLFG